MEKLYAFLQHTKYANYFIERLVKEDYEYPHLFILTSPEGKRYYLKTGLASDPQLKTSLPLMEKIKDSTDLIQKYQDILRHEQHYLLITEEVTGHSSKKSSMKELFRRLALFHRENEIPEGPLTSNYMDYREYPSISELLEKEFEMHEENLPESGIIPKLRIILEPLKRGFRTVIHGNIHKGNMVLKKTPLLIDTETVHMSNNFYDFEFFDFFCWYGESPCYIQKEALECYHSYFRELGLSLNDRNMTILAIELLNLLRENTYRKCMGDRKAYEWAEPRFMQLVEAFDRTDCHFH